MYDKRRPCGGRRLVQKGRAAADRAAIPLARLASLLRGELPDAELAVIEELLADPQLGRRPRARLLFGFAHVLDARREFGRAAECLREANYLSLELIPDHQRFCPKSTKVTLPAS